MRWKDRMESLTPPADSIDKKLKITHVECHPESLVIVFQAQYNAGCELDYYILQNEIQRVFKVKDDVCVGGSCLVEDTDGEWHRGRVLRKKGNICEAFLIDTGHVLAVEETHLAAACDELFQLPPKVVLGVFASILPLGERWGPKAINYFSSLVGLQITGHVKAVTPYQLFILEVPKIITDVLELQLGKFIDGDSFCLVVETLGALPQGMLGKGMPQLLKQKYPFRELLTLNNSEKPADFWHGPDHLFPCLPVGSEEDVKITGAVSPNKFYCQIQKWQKELENLTGAMHLYYEALVGENTTSCDSLGLLCAAKRRNGQWHRGVIKQLLSDHMEVWFMDFGIIEAVPPSCIRKLKAEFLTLPMISFLCTLSCFGSQDETVIQFQLKELTQALMGQTSVCVHVDLYNNTEHLYYITLQKQNLGINAECPENRNEKAALCVSLLETKTRSIAPNDKLSPERNNSPKNYPGNKDTKTCLPEWNVSFFSHCKSDEMQMNSFYGAFVVYVISPSDFWIQTCRYHNEFQALMKNIACTYSQCRDDEMVLKKPEPGLLCCARYSRDGCYYRAVVTKVFRVSIVVYFLDFGNTDTIPCHNVKTLLPEFSDLPALAMCCSLAHTFPVDGVWVRKETDFFKNVVLNKPLLLHVIGKQNNKYIVNVQCHTDFLQGNVAACMVQAGYAEYQLKPPNSVLRAAKKRHNRNHLKCKKEKINAENTSNICKNKVTGNGDILQKEKSLSVLPVPRESVVPSCFGEGAVSKMHKSVCEEKLVYKELVFKPGAVYEVVCSCIFSPSDFSCQLQSNLPELDNLMGQIQTYYKDHTSPYKTGQVACVVKCPKDGKWYRAAVVQQVSTNEVDVVFVDYGYRERASLKDLQGVLPDFLTLESQAFRCGLKNVVLRTNSINWSEEVHRQFEDFISSCRGPLTCTIYALVLVSPNCLCNVVDLQTPLTSVEEFLRERGLTQSDYVGLRNLSSLGSLYSFCYSSFNIKIGSEEEVYITHINSPSKFYCHLNRNTETLGALMKKVSDLSKMSNNANYHTGNTRLCIARYVEDGLFYRALAFPVESTSFLWVDYVDFGNKSMVERDHLMPIPDSATDLLFTPMQAIQFCLSDLRGTEFPARITTWFVKTFRGKLLKAVILSRESDGKIVVELYDGQLKVSQKIKEKVLEELAQESRMEQFRSNEGEIHHMKDDKEINKVSVKDPEILKLKTEVKCQVYDEYYRADTGENFGDEEQTACSSPKLCSGFSKQQTLQDSKEQGFRNTFSAVLENGEEPWSEQPASHSLSYSALNSKEITVNALSESHNERLNCTGQQKRSNKNIPTLISLPQRDIQVNTEVTGYISHMNSPSSFYVHFAEDENLIMKLADDLNESLENRGRENCLDELMVGDLIVAEHDADCFYYRAVIKTLKPGNSYEVEFIDYGNAAVVSSSKICRIPEKFLTLPRFSVHCFLSSVKSVPGEGWTKESAAYFARTVSDKPVACKFLQQHGEKWEIDVICDGESLSNSLLQEIDSTRWKSRSVFALENKSKQNGSPQESKNSLGGQNKTKATRMKNISVKSLSLLHRVLNSGQVEAAEVVNILKSGEFYVQLLKNVQILHELNVMLDKEAQRSGLLKVDDIEQGLECITQSERNLKWYRSKVIKKFVREKLMLVFFMDYGTYEMVSLNNAKMLSDEIKSIPKQAVFCRWICFKNLKKIHLGRVASALLDCEIRILFLRYLKSFDVWEVNILIGEVTLQEYLNQLLSRCWTIVGPEKCGNTHCKEFDTSFKINSVMWMLLRSGRTYPGCATAVTDPSNFSVQFEVFFDCMRNLSSLLSDLPDNLPALSEEHVTPGASCLIEFGQEAQWYRAEISEVTSQSVALTFIDYGFLRSIPYSDIHKLKVVPESLLYLPHLAHSCSLHDTVPGKGEHWSEEAILLFQKLLHKPGLIFHFIHYSSEMKLEVDILCEDSNLSDALIAAGHAVCSHSRCCPIPVDRL
ncbi:PREDICTED: tudor domain-containing protein 15 [Corvus brachyrhynchos]|uniref:tudor domain-containing protein 15 n=1 Tax=Corvus brachyrhynchos TaxID=85066 RepID=UPI0008164203|nr:PREDICTED: tudor domain-containing protein 15 [Corvus brachyrhynchos]